MRDETYHVLDSREFDTLVNEHLKPALFYEVVDDQEWDNGASHIFSISEETYTVFDRDEVKEFITSEGIAFTSPAILLSELATRGIIPWGNYLIEACW